MHFAKGSGIISQSSAQQAVYCAWKTAVGNKLETFADRIPFVSPQIKKEEMSLTIMSHCDAICCSHHISGSI